MKMKIETSHGVQCIACHMIQMICTSQLKSVQATKTSRELFSVIVQLLHILFGDLTCPDALTKVLMHSNEIKCVQIKSCALFTVHRLNLVHLSDADLVCNMTSI